MTLSQSGPPRSTKRAMAVRHKRFGDLLELLHGPPLSSQMWNSSRVTRYPLA